jgi:L,D-transpeptidase YcbB
MRGIYIKSAVVLLSVISALLLHPMSISAMGDRLEIADPTSKQIQRIFKRRTRVSGVSIQSRTYAKEFYEGRDYAPAWSKDGVFSTRANSLISAIDSVDEEGLVPTRYHADKIGQLIQKLSALGTSDPTTQLADLDILMTDAFFLIASDYLFGRFDRYGKLRGGVTVPKGFDLVGVLNGAIENKKVADALKQLLPQHGWYTELKKAIPGMKIIAESGGWPKVPAIPRGKKILPGEVDPRVVVVRRRLEASGDIPGGMSEPHDNIASEEIYDEELVGAVIKFQRDHGLEPDGVIGSGTAAAMNISAKTRLAQLKINMDRMRAWASMFDSSRYVVANFPAFEVMVFEDGRDVLNMRAIVGQYDRQSPIMSNEIKFLVFSPKWHVPVSIAVKDKLPILVKDPSYIRRMGMTVYDMSSGDKVQVDSNSIDWTKVEASEETFPYHIVQRPGRGNALGKVKFMFPNKHSVYMHDTSQPSLFMRQNRMFSSGCIRIQKPVELAKYLLRDKADWTDERISKSMNRSKVLFVNLTEPVPVHLVYFTAWAGDGRGVRFFRDIYRLDKAYERTLSRR